MAQREHYARLAELLSYPGPDLPALAERAAEALAGLVPEAARAVASFRAATSALPLGRLEEVYSATFDLNPACCPYLGYHRFAESPKRAALMVGLKQAYAAVGLASEGELPDHLCLVLRYLALAEDAELAGELRDEVLLPGLEKMLQALAGSDNAYASLLHAALLVARREQEIAPAMAKAVGQTSPPPPPRHGEGSLSSPFPRREVPALSVAKGGQGVRFEPGWEVPIDGAGGVGCSPKNDPSSQTHVGGAGDV